MENCGPDESKFTIVLGNYGLPIVNYILCFSVLQIITFFSICILHSASSFLETVLWFQLSEPNYVNHGTSEKGESAILSNEYFLIFLK